MSVRIVMASLAAASLLAGAACADDAKPDGERGKARNAEMRKKLIEKFDADGDGKLNDEEKAKAREERKKHSEEMRAEHIKKFDADGDDKLSAEEKAKMREEMKKRFGDRGRGAGGHGGRGPHGPDFRKKMLEKFDADADGKLSEDERAKAKEEMKKQFEEKRAERIKKFDADGDGKLSDDEKAKMKEEMKKRSGDRKPGAGRPGGKGPRDPEFRKKMLEKFDADGDGKLSDEEKAKLREEMKAKRENREKKAEA